MDQNDNNTAEVMVAKVTLGKGALGVVASLGSSLQLVVKLS